MPLIYEYKGVVDSTVKYTMEYLLEIYGNIYDQPLNKMHQ